MSDPERKSKFKSALLDRCEIDHLSNSVSIPDVFTRLYPNQIWKGSKTNCPFHRDQTPSFHYYLENNRFYCFSCQLGGDVIELIRQIEGVGFFEALEILKSWRGPRRAILVKQKERNSTIDFELANQVLDKFWKQSKRNFANLTERDVLSHLEERGIEIDCLEFFGTGSFFGEESLEGFDQSEIKVGKQMGLFDCGEDLQPSNRFSNRLVFPLRDEAFKLRGFVGRGFLDSPKYLVTKDSSFFSKGETFFGWSETKEEIQKACRVVIVEGVFDLIGLWQVGIRNVVSVLGNRISKRQADYLQSCSIQVDLLFDGDRGGIEGAECAFNLLQERKIGVRLLEIPKGLDPEEATRFLRKLILKEGSKL